ncbi:unnamed protein product [marine sediment metagenome]|uniref:Uncharacterized protein n=1 Tax=marine sediment metagenome TaxID=412755 RepID=X1IP32_9ZZZZ
MLDKDNYPDAKSLKAIERWNILKQGIQGLLDLVQQNTWPDEPLSITGKRVLYFQYHTLGWSGNEDTIAALRHNILFFPFFWQKSVRGGHYYFKINPITQEHKRKEKIK